MFKFFRKKKEKKRLEIERKIANLKQLRTEYLEDAAYWHMQGDHKEYMKSVVKVAEVTDQILMCRRELYE